MSDLISIVDHLFTSTMAVVSRRTSDDNAVVKIAETIQGLQKKYTFLKNIKILQTQYVETDPILTIDSEINKVNAKELVNALNEFVVIITEALGKNAGFFFIRELKDHMGFNWHLKLKKIGVDLDILQYGFSVDRINKLSKKIDTVEIVKNLLMISVDIMKYAVSYRYAIPTLNNIIVEMSDKYKFLQQITIYDIRFTQGTEEVFIDQHLNSINVSQLNLVINEILMKINKSLEENGYFSYVHDLKRGLGSEYRLRMEELGFELTIQQFGLQIIINRVLNTIYQSLNNLDIAKDSKQILDASIKNISKRYKFLYDIKYRKYPNALSGQIIQISSDLSEVSDLETGRALKLVILDIMQSLSYEHALNFIKNIRASLDSAFISKLEIMGLNLYMLQLRQELRKTA